MPLTAEQVIIQQTNTYPRKRDKRWYSYQSAFGNHPPIFYDLKNIPWFIGQSNDTYWLKHRRKNREYRYPYSFGNEAWFKNLKNISSIFGQSNDIYWSKHRRKNKEYRYSSFFMKLNFLDTNWSCDTLSTDDTWTCEEVI